MGIVYTLKAEGITWESGSGSVGRAVASDTRGPRFESFHLQNLYVTLLTVNCIEKKKIKKKRPGMDPF